MLDLPKDKMKRLVAIHGWSGLVLGVMLYVVVLTGAIAVFAAEIGTWSVGGKKWEDPLRRWVSVAVSETIDTVPAEYHEDISIYPNSAGRLVLFYHTHAINPDGDLDDKGVLMELDPASHEVLERREGFSDDLFGHDAAGALDEFIVDLHVNLHAPDPWGLYLTGVLGFAMLIAAITGFILHRHLVKDLFLSPRPSSRLLNSRDRHNLLGSWGLPFAVVLAFTGAYFSLAGPLGFPVLTMVAFGGDEQAMVDTLVGKEPETAPPRPTSMAHLDGVLNQARARAQAPVDFVQIEHWGRSDAEIIVWHPPAPGGYRSVALAYDGVTGAFRGEHIGIGTRPSAGDSLVNLFGALHFGTFAGLLSRLVWLGLGLAMAYLTWTGVRLWLERRADDPLWARLRLALPTIGYGLPLALAAAAVGFFLSLPSATTRFWTAAAFVAASLAILGVGYAARDECRLSRGLRLALGAALVLLPVLRVAVTGPGWTAPEDGGIVLLLDVALLTAGGLYLYAVLAPSARRDEAGPRPRALAETPAE